MQTRALLLIGMMVASRAFAWEPSAPPCASTGAFGQCAMSEFADRPYSVYRPSTHDLTVATAVVLVLHGGNGNANGGIAMSCSTGSLGDSSCWHNEAERSGFVLVVPNGTRASAGSTQRQWNAGGGSAGWQCVSAQACAAGVDDVAYIRAVLADVDRWMHLNRGAVFATGLSNGAALAHRLACEMSDAIVAIAPVGGGNQFESTRSCVPSRPVAVLGIHGTGDPCWTYSESSATCLGAVVGRKVGIAETMANWALRNACGNSSAQLEDDSDGDGVRSTAITWSGCRAQVKLLRIEGGGHTYPNGHQYLPATSIGPTLREWGAERVYAFFAAQVDPDGADRIFASGFE